VSRPERVTVEASGVGFTALAWGPADGPLALCLHGYPDTARTWRHLGPALAERGFRVVAPYMRGYAPTGLAPDGCYQVGALARDAAHLHQALGGDERAVLVGHDWGAAATYVAGADPQPRFRRLVTMAVPPNRALLAPASPGVVVRQLRMSWYMFFNLLPRLSEESLERLIPRLWAAWSPGYDAREDVADVLKAVRDPVSRNAALRYYRATLLPWTRSREYAAEEARGFDVPDVPLLYLHGEDDGCIQAEIARGSERVLPPHSRVEIVPGAGHFLHLERPAEVNGRIAASIES
jgi:pimeloyl-ACP methyl ester carboxylesterase